MSDRTTDPTPAATARDALVEVARDWHYERHAMTVTLEECDHPRCIRAARALAAAEAPGRVAEECVLQTPWCETHATYHYQPAPAPTQSLTAAESDDPPLGFVVWRAWFEGMESQGRSVEPRRRSWETLSEQDHDLDAVIETRVAAFVLDRHVKRFPCTPAAAEAPGRVVALEVALVWCSGSQDFAPGGVAREGWERIVQPLLAAAAATEAPGRVAALRGGLAEMMTLAGFLQSCVLSGESLSDADRVRVAACFDAARSLLDAPAPTPSEPVARVITEWSDGTDE